MFRSSAAASLHADDLFRSPEQMMADKDLKRAQEHLKRAQEHLKRAQDILENAQHLVEISRQILDSKRKKPNVSRSRKDAADRRDAYAARIGKLHVDTITLASERRIKLPESIYDFSHR